MNIMQETQEFFKKKSNSNLNTAKKAKNDEFYTRLEDIEKELGVYLDYNPDIFKDKVILLPCDNPQVSNFTQFFVRNFSRLRLKRLMSTSYSRSAHTLPTSVDNANSENRGKLLVVDGDNIDSINVDAMQFGYLEGNGDFRSEEVTKLRDEADIVITNPPFSLLRDFVPWLFAGGVDFAFIGGLHISTYKEVFPYIKSSQMWLGENSPSLFSVPFGIDVTSSPKVIDGIIYQKINNTRWFSTFDYHSRHTLLTLDTMDTHRTNNKSIYSHPGSYIPYDNFDAIEVPSVSGIPVDYTGVMGVPLTFLDKHNPEQFEIVHWRYGDDMKDLRYTINGVTKLPFSRILIRAKVDDES